jgi:hypothetical protein
MVEPVYRSNIVNIRLDSLCQSLINYVMEPLIVPRAVAQLPTGGKQSVGKGLKQQSQLRVKTAVEEVMDKDLPETYDRILFKEKSAKLFELIYDYASKGRKWAA